MDGKVTQVTRRGPDSCHRGKEATDINYAQKTGFVFKE